jgi:tetratricopeptide (TPR) repeat protein
VFSVVSGSEIIHKEWTSSYSINRYNANNIFEIEKKGNQFNIYVKNTYKDLLCSFSGTEWFGPHLGPLIGAGAKIVLDYLRVEGVSPCNKTTMLIQQGDQFIERDNAIAAYQKYTEALQNGCKSAEVYTKRATAHFRLKDFDSAIEDCNEAISMTMDNEMAYFIRGVCKLYLNDISGEEDLLRGGEQGKKFLKELEYSRMGIEN